MMRGEVLERDFIAVTENAAIAAAQTMGYGDRRHSDQVAVEAMRKTLEEIGVAGRVVIGEGEQGEAPSLYIGETLGGLEDAEGKSAVDIAVDPLEGSRQCAIGAPGAVVVLAASERGGLLQVPDIYMEKIIVGPTARGVIHLDAPVPENLRNIAKAFKRDVSDLTVVVLDRERHAQLVNDIREAGARIRLIPDGDLSAGISAAVRGTGVHAVMGTGGAPEGVIVAAAMRCLGGEIQGRLVAKEERHKVRAREHKIRNLKKIYTTKELAPGKNIFFSCTGVTDGELLRGVRFFGGGSRTSTLYMSLENCMIRFVDSVRRENPKNPVMFR